MIIETNFTYQAGHLSLNKNPLYNIINIGDRDFLVHYLDPITQKHKGGNSHIFALYPAQEQYDDVRAVQEMRPQKVIKVSKNYDNINANNEIKKSKFNERFFREIAAIKACNDMHNPNVVEIYENGHIVVSTEDGALAFPFYIMDYAEFDLKKYLEEVEVDINDRINICIQIATGIQGLLEAEYYHRDIKPDNILIFEGGLLKVGDLGLAAHRNDDCSKELGIIGPRGWLSPEAMNKYLSVGFNDNKFDCIIDHQSDIFQLGKLFWYVVQGNVPIGCFERNDFKHKSGLLYELIQEMLQYDKHRRVNDLRYVIEKLLEILNK